MDSGFPLHECRLRRAGREKRQRAFQHCPPDPAYRIRHSMDNLIACLSEIRRHQSGPHACHVTLSWRHAARLQLCEPSPGQDHGCPECSHARCRSAASHGDLPDHAGIPETHIPGPEVREYPRRKGLFHLLSTEAPGAFAMHLPLSCNQDLREVS